jgi:hypothetical protein
MNGSTHRHRMVAAGIGLLAVGVAVMPAPGAFASRPAVVDESSIERAVAGVSLFISENADALATGITAACPLMTRDEFGWFMGQQDLAPSLEGWSVGLFMYDGVGSGAPGLSCGVDIAGHVGGAGDGAPHGVRLEAVVVPDGATFGDLLGVVEGGRVISAGGPEIGGEIGGACFPGEVVVCVLLWSRSGLAITTVLAGPAASVTEARTIALMTSMIPSMVQGLGRYATDFGPPPTAPVTTAVPTTIPEPPLDIAAARATLAEFTAAHPVGTSGPEVAGGLGCPSSTAATIAETMSAAGLAPDLDPFLVSVRGSAIAAGLLTVSCGGDVIDALVQATAGVVPTYTPSLTAYDISGIATIDHVLAERPGLVQIQSGMSAIGGDLYGSACDVVSGSGTFCVRVWHRDGLVVMFEVSGNARPDFDAAATQVITGLVPIVVTNLATHATWPGSSAGLG